MDAERNIRVAAADLLLGRGVRFKLKGAPFLWRLFRLDRFTIRALKLGVIIEIARVAVADGLDAGATQKHLEDKMQSVCLCVAMAILNDRRRIKRRAPRLARLMMRKLPAATILNVFYYIQNVDGILDFTNITGFIAAHAKMTSPKQGRAAKGS